MIKLPFNGNENLKNYSQAGQDLFVLSCLNGKKQGKFLEFGCNHPHHNSNTYLLEKEFEWSGISIDIDKTFTDMYADRKSTITLNLDCTKLDFDNLCQLANTNHFDYLSLDLEPASVTLKCLESIPFEKISFSVLTFEHDYYRFGSEIVEKSRDLLQKNGYKILCSNVKSCGLIFEDWYVNSKHVEIERCTALECTDQEWTNIVYK